MKKDVYIDICGVQELDGEKDKMEMTTEGSFYDKDGKYWAFYIDGEYAPTGVDKTEIKNGCSYMFKAE